MQIFPKLKFFVIDNNPDNKDDPKRDIHGPKLDGTKDKISLVN